MYFMHVKMTTCIAFLYDMLEHNATWPIYNPLSCPGFYNLRIACLDFY